MFATIIKKVVLMLRILVSVALCLFPMLGISAEQSPPTRNASVEKGKKDINPIFQTEAYRFGKINLECSLPTGNIIEIAPVTDNSDFMFLAIRGRSGPLILANEKYIRERMKSDAVFSFYKECAMHAITKVNATGPDDALYDKHLIKLAECLAVLPTIKAFESGISVSLGRISGELLRENKGAITSTTYELNLCRSPTKVSKLWAATKQIK